MWGRNSNLYCSWTIWWFVEIICGYSGALYRCGDCLLFLTCVPSLNNFNHDTHSVASFSWLSTEWVCFQHHVSSGESKWSAVKLRECSVLLQMSYDIIQTSEAILMLRCYACVLKTICLYGYFKSNIKTLLTDWLTLMLFLLDVALI